MVDVGGAVLWLLFSCDMSAGVIAALAWGNELLLLTAVRGFGAALTPRGLGGLKFLKIPSLLG